MSSIEEPSTNESLHRLFLYTTIFIILAGAQYFDEAFLTKNDVDMLTLNEFFPEFAQITGPTLLLILIANIHTKYQSIQLTANTRDIILAFAIGAIIFLEIFHAYLSGYPLELEFAYDLLLIFLCYSAIKSFDFGANYIDTISNTIRKTTFAIALLCLLAIIFDFSHTKTIFFKGDCLESMNIFTYYSSLCRPTENYIYRIAQLAPFVIVLTFWSIFRNKGNKLFHIILITLLVFIIYFSKARLPWMLSFVIIALAGLFTIYRWRGLKMASAAALLCLMLLASLIFFFGETFDRFLSLNRGLTPELEAEIGGWDVVELNQSGVLLRFEHFLVGLRQFAEHPIFGRGAGTIFSAKYQVEILHGIPIIYGVGYGLVGLTAFVALLFPRLGLDAPDDWLFMKVTLLIVVIAILFLLQHPPFWFAAAAVFLQVPYKKYNFSETIPR